MAEAGDGDQDDARVEVPQAFVAEAHALHDAGAEVLQHDVRLLDERSKDLLALWVPQIQTHALLAAVVDGEVHALPADEGRHATRLLAAVRRFPFP